MAWYDSAWSHRFPILVDKLTAGTIAVDVTAVVPPTLSDFWDNLQSNGDDIRVTDADGRTLETYDIAAGFDATLRQCTIEVQTATPPVADCMFVLWAYVGNAGAASAKTPFTPSSPRTGHLSAYVPQGDVFRFARPAPGQTQPSQVFQVATGDEPTPWVLFDRALQNLSAAYEGKRWGEEIAWVQEQVLRQDADSAARYDESLLRMAGRGAIRAHLHDSVLTSGQDYTLRLLVGTTESRILDSRVLVKCQDVDEGA